MRLSLNMCSSYQIQCHRAAQKASPYRADARPRAGVGVDGEGMRLASAAEEPGALVTHKTEGPATPGGVAGPDSLASSLA